MEVFYIYILHIYIAIVDHYIRRIGNENCTQTFEWHHFNDLEWPLKLPTFQSHHNIQRQITRLITSKFPPREVHET